MSLGGLHDYRDGGFNNIRERNDRALEEEDRAGKSRGHEHDKKNERDPAMMGKTEPPDRQITEEGSDKRRAEMKTGHEQQESGEQDVGDGGWFSHRVWPGFRNHRLCLSSPARS